jgi:hypothetical protein
METAGKAYFVPHSSATFSKQKTKTKKKSSACFVSSEQVNFGTYGILVLSGQDLVHMSSSDPFSEK